MKKISVRKLRLSLLLLPLLAACATPKPPLNWRASYRIAARQEPPKGFQISYRPEGFAEMVPEPKKQVVEIPTHLGVGTWGSNFEFVEKPSNGNQKNSGR